MGDTPQQRVVREANFRSLPIGKNGKPMAIIMASGSNLVPTV